MEDRTQTESNSTDLIVIEQLPVISEQLRTVSAEIRAEVEAALAAPCTEETYKDVKKLRSSLTATLGMYEQRRKDVKAAIMAPYEEFEAVYKEFISDQLKDADKALVARISAVENELKQRKVEEARAYFDEYAASIGVNMPTYEDAGIEVNMTITVKKMCAAVKLFLDRVKADLALIEQQDNSAEILEQYAIDYNCVRAMNDVSKRHQTMRELKERLDAEKAKNEEDRARAEAVKAAAEAARQEAAILQPPKQVAPAPLDDDDPVLTLAFTVVGPRSKLRELKKWMLDNGLKAE